MPILAASAQVGLPTRRATIALARKVAAVVREGDLVVLAGELGAGKTFLARALIRALGVPTTVRIASPTFSLVQEYVGRLRIRHSDLYRVQHAAEVVDLGLADDRTTGAVLIVEWGVPFVGALGGDALRIELRILNDGSRLAVFSAGGERSCVMVHAAVAVMPPC
jgi:tRNA threonylcarbamoyladenosine biosynthesis protein TsaE